MVETTSIIGMILIGVSILLCVWRIFVGPTTPDRTIAFDTIAVNVLAFIVLLSISQNTNIYFDAVLIIAVIAFVGTVAIAKYLIKGDIIE